MQRLRHGLAAKGWKTKTFKVEKVINGEAREAITHKMDHVRTFPGDDNKQYTIAMEIEWNNKDPFFDRDLNNFRLLFDRGVVSVGVIITRCDEIQDIVTKLGRGSSFGEKRMWLTSISSCSFFAPESGTET